MDVLYGAERMALEHWFEVRDATQENHVMFINYEPEEVLVVDDRFDGYNIMVIGKAVVTTPNLENVQFLLRDIDNVCIETAVSHITVQARSSDVLPFATLNSFLQQQNLTVLVEHNGQFLRFYYEKDCIVDVDEFRRNTVDWITTLGECDDDCSDSGGEYGEAQR